MTLDLSKENYARYVADMKATQQSFYQDYDVTKSDVTIVILDYEDWCKQMKQLDGQIDDIPLDELGIKRRSE